MAELPPDGLPFFLTSDGNIVIDGSARSHFDLLAVHLGFDFALGGDFDRFVTEQANWFRSQRPRLGRVALRGGKLDLVTLTKPLDESPEGSELVEQEHDVSIAQSILAQLEAVHACADND